MKEEIWKDIAGYEGFYQVSTKGRVKSLPRQIKTIRGTRQLQGKLIAPRTQPSGYYIVGLSKFNSQKTISIHRLVAMAFIPNPNNLREVNHKDFQKTNNFVENLEWCSSSENKIHAYKNSMDFGKRKGLPQRVQTAKNLIADGNSIRKVLKIARIDFYTLKKHL